MSPAVPLTLGKVIFSHCELPVWVTEGEVMLENVLFAFIVL